MDEYEFEIDDDYGIDTEYEDITRFKLRLVSHKIRTAKKTYKCENCGAEIAVNTKYMDFATKYKRTRLCVKCGKTETGED